MGDECVTVVEMSIGALEAADRADAVIQWLLDTGVVVPNLLRGSAWQPSGYLPGPRAPVAAPGFRDTDYTLANNGSTSSSNASSTGTPHRTTRRAAPTAGTSWPRRPWRR